MPTPTTQMDELQARLAALARALDEQAATVVAIRDGLRAAGPHDAHQADGSVSAPVVQWTFHKAPKAPGCLHPSNRLICALLEASATALRRHVPELAQQVVDQVAAEIAQELCSRLGPGDVYVPGQSGELRSRRDDAIRAAFDRPGADGVSERSPARARQLAKHHGLTVRRVRSILAGK